MVVDCDSKEGITIGLIDSLIAISKVLARQIPAYADDMHPEVREALCDLATEPNLQGILKAAQRAVEYKHD